MIIHETYYSNTSSSVYETDSLGKTAVATIVGLLVEDGLLDIDTPIKEYGVADDLASWSASGTNYFSRECARARPCVRVCVCVCVCGWVWVSHTQKHANT